MSGERTVVTEPVSLAANPVLSVGGTPAIITAVFHGFPQSIPSNYREGTSSGPRPLSFNFFLSVIHHLSSIYHLPLYNLVNDRIVK
jgi:hypothetical protein